MKKNDDDVLFEVSQGAEEETMDQEVTADVADVAATDDIPLAVAAGEEDTLADDAPDTAADAADNGTASDARSAWKILSSEDLPAVSLREILGGDYLIGSFLRQNIGFILLLVAMGIIYISNRYGAQQEIIEEENLRKELTEKKNYALTQYAQLTMQTRQSALERRLKAMGDSTLLSAKEPPFIIIKQK